jgi:glycosyltransferase involved in cell wall biosynthesis
MIAGLVSTIIPVFNRAAMLREAVHSVLEQTWRPIEVVIVDDGSTDGTLAVAHKLRASYPDVIRLLSQVNAGPGSARQAGLEAAQGEFIQFLDSDDLLLPEKFALQVTGLRQDVEAGITYGKTYTREGGVRGLAPAQRSGEKHRTVFPALLTGRLWETSTPLYRRSALDRIGLWPAKRQMEDWEFDAQAGAAGIQLHYSDDWLSEYVIHDEHRLASAWRHDEAALADMVEAHLAISKHARTAGVPAGSDHMEHFARTLFWLARLSASRAAAALAARALDAAESAAAPDSPIVREVRVYRAASRLCGWRNIGTLCAWRDRYAGKAVSAVDDRTT